jgi:threonine aldolase
VHPRAIHTLPNGQLPLEAIEDAVRSENVHFPVSRLICLENTHNRCGGAVLDEAYTASVGALARRHGLQLHLDGARIFNAAAALGIPAAHLAAPADSVTFCLSKALCAPVGSVLCGERDFLRPSHPQATGGGMRQAESWPPDRGAGEDGRPAPARSPQGADPARRLGEILAD